MGGERIHVSGWGERGLAPPQPPRGAALGTLPDRAQRGPRQGLLQPHPTGGKTERGKDLPDATKLSVTGPDSDRVSVPSLSLIPGQEDRSGEHPQNPPTACFARPPRSPGSAAARSYRSPGSLHFHPPGTRPSGTSPRPGPGGSGRPLGFRPPQAPWPQLAVPPTPGTQVGVEEKKYTQGRGRSEGRRSLKGPKAKVKTSSGNRLPHPARSDPLPKPWGLAPPRPHR